MAEKFYVTTTIPYSNAKPHIGHALEFVQADVLARWNRLIGKKVFFLTGTDEHGTKNFQMAKKVGEDTLTFVNKNAQLFKDLLKKLDISNDYFIRTTDRKVHWPGVLEMWKKLEASGDIYEKEYAGKYCSGCERFVTEKDLVNGQCPNHPKLDVQVISEKNIFFRLSKYSDEIKKKIESGELEIYPQRWKNDFLGLIKDGLIDVSFSRDKEHLPWGVPVPGRSDQVMYVWCDALTNYLTGIGFPDEKYKDFWPADVHVVGKDMLRFHTGIWPGMLLSAGLPLPKKVIVHGFLTVNGEKMSKSTGNVVDPSVVVDNFGSDALRYYLCRNFVFGEDGDFSMEGVVRRYNDELADKFGNLISRVSGLAEKNGVEESLTDITVKFEIKKVIAHIEAYEFDKALSEIFSFVDFCNEYVQKHKPWETGDRMILYELLLAIKKVTILLSPFIPHATGKVAKHFGFSLDLKELDEPFKISKIEKVPILFTKIDFPKPNLNKAEEPKQFMEGVANIQYSDFAKLDLRVGEIHSVENIEGADKLYKLTIGLGGEVRTICAGIKEYYSHEQLKGKKVVVIANLEPRKLRGIESQGMLLAAGSKESNICSLLTPDDETISPGTKIS